MIPLEKQGIKTAKMLNLGKYMLPNITISNNFTEECGMCSTDILKKKHYTYISPLSMSKLEICNDCALREFNEETGYNIKYLQNLQNVIPYEEIFTGSNMKSYKHKYFVGTIDANTVHTNQFQQSEVSEMKWMSYEECMEKIRPYNLEKKNLLSKINTIVQMYKMN